ncbi:MAG TPA: hypothetical protein VKQ32_06230 [Polyangia bacterium]|nr:hypothetical protein [Polyangia bacterium]
MIVVVNALALGFEHVPFDAAFLASLAQAYPGEPIHFYGDRDHSEQVQRFLQPRFGGGEIVWRVLALPPRLAAPRARMTRDAGNLRTVLAEAQRASASRVVVCYLHAVTGILALKALRLAYRRGALALVHHASLLRLLSSRRYHPLLTLGNGRLGQIVLGDAIRREAIAMLPRLAGSLHAIRHPYFFDEAAPSDLPAAGPIGFSFLGLVDETKGFDKFVALAETISRSSDGAARFDLIGGKRAGELPGSPGGLVKTYVQSGPMPRPLFEQRLRETAYTVFPYDPSFYRLAASGSMLDALGAGKPIIALRNPQFEETFAAMGDIGYLCDDVDQMKSVVASILGDPPRERYRRQSTNVLAKRDLFGTAAVAAELRAALDA